jgi:hypothetical protein
MRDLTIRVAAALFGAASATLAQQGEERTLVLRSLAPFAAPALQLGEPICSALPGDQTNDAPLALDAAGDADPAGWLLGLLEQRHRAAISEGRLQLRQSREPVFEDGKQVGERLGPMLVLQGARAAVDACSRELDAIAAVIARPIEVTAYRLPLRDGELPATVWNSTALQQALRDTPPLWTTRARTRSGGALRLGQERGIGHLRDLDTEVAEKAVITDPKVDIAFAGARATLVADSLGGEQVLLRGSWLLSEPVAVHEQEVGKGVSVDLPEHRTALVTFAGRVDSGGALVVAGRGGPIGPDGFVLVLTARYLAPPPGDIAPDLTVRPVGAFLAAPALRRPAIEWRRPGDDSPTFPVETASESLRPTDLFELLAARGPAEVELEHGMLIVHGDFATCRRADTMLQQLTAALRPVSWQVRATADGSPPLELVQPALGDHATAAFVGSERAVVRDQEVEIAAKASSANPVIGIARSGLAFGGTASPAGDRTFYVDATWTLSVHGKPRQRQHADAAAPMTLQLVDYRTAVLPWQTLMATGQLHELGTGPAFFAGGPDTAISVRLSTP